MMKKKTFSLAQEAALLREQEHKAERELARQLVDVGFRALAKELHPDTKHGNVADMQRLVRLRDKLKHCV